MSTQADTAFRILIRMYIEFDQRSGWASEAQVVKVMETQERISTGRSEDAIKLLKSLKMLDARRENDQAEIKISAYGVEWMDKTCPLESRHPEYSFSLPTFRSVKLVGPDTFYGRNQSVKSTDVGSIDWTKWGALAALIAIPTMIILWWLTD